MPSLPYISADIGGSHITIAAIDPQSRSIIPGTIVNSKVDNKGAKDHILDTWCQALEETIAKTDNFRGVGFAMPGPFDYFNGISKIKGVQKYEALYDVDVRSSISQKLKLTDKQPVRFINDATAFAIGECWGGLAKNYQKVMAITLGTGFGSAFINNSIPVLTGDTVPDLGCVYHLPYKNGIADDYFSTRWFINKWEEKSGSTIKGVKELAQLATSGNSEAHDLFVEFGENLGSFLSPWIKKFGAQCLVIGGNISNANSLFNDSLQKVFDLHQAKVQVLFSSLQEEAALIGAGHLVDDDFYKDIEPLLQYM